MKRLRSVEFDKISGLFFASSPLKLFGFFFFWLAVKPLRDYCQLGTVHNLQLCLKHSVRSSYRHQIWITTQGMAEFPSLLRSATHLAELNQAKFMMNKNTPSQHADNATQAISVCIITKIWNKISDSHESWRGNYFSRGKTDCAIWVGERFPFRFFYGNLTANKFTPCN